MSAAAAFVEKRLSPTMASRFKGNNTSNGSLNNVVVLAATVHSLETLEATSKKKKKTKTK